MRKFINKNTFSHRSYSFYLIASLTSTNLLVAIQGKTERHCLFGSKLAVKHKRKLERGKMQRRENLIYSLHDAPVVQFHANPAFALFLFPFGVSNDPRTPYYTRPGRFFPSRQPVRVSIIVLAIANLQETLSLSLS